MREYLLLKWGTVKGWDNIRPENQPLLEEYLKNSSMSCAMDKPNEARKLLLCKLIDNLDGDIWNDWDNKKYKTKEAAKEYIINYGMENI